MCKVIVVAEKEMLFNDVTPEFINELRQDIKNLMPDAKIKVNVFNSKDVEE